MSGTPKFAMCDTRKPDGFYVQFERKVVDDDSADAPDDKDEGFWPSQDKDAAGYCGDVSEEDFQELRKDVQARWNAWERGDWGFVGVRAMAKCFIVRNHVGTYINLESAGLWGIESDSGEEYLNEVYQEQVEELKATIAAMQNPVYED